MAVSGTNGTMTLDVAGHPARRVSPGWCAGLAAFAFLCILGCGSVAAQVDYWPPWVTQTTATSATINWRGATGGSGSVDYATSAWYEEHHTLPNTVVSGTADFYQHVPFPDLQPATSYVYRARPSDSRDQFNVRTFQTTPSNGPFTFLVISDSHAQEERFQSVAAAIAQYETDPLFILDGGDYASWDYEPYWSTYFQYGDAMLAKFPLFNTIGNHEYHNYGNPLGPPTDADCYHKTFDVVQGGALNHSFDYGGVRFVVLNSPDPAHSNGDDPQTSLALAKSQAAWLEALLDNDMAGTFTIHHHPIWDYGRAGINPHLQPWESLYHKYAISANFAGHTHNYQRYSVKGIPYFVVGNGGGKFADMDPNDKRAKWYQYGDTRKLGYLRVTVDPANNTGLAEEVFIGYVESDDSKVVHLYTPPKVVDTVSFFLVPNLSTLTVTKQGLGSGAVASSDGRIACGATCQANYKQSGRVTLTPAPHAGMVFSGWTGACSGSGKCQFAVRPRSNVAVGAIFAAGSCTYYISPSARTFNYRGGTITVRVTARDYGYCRAPDVTNNTDWITYTATEFVNNRGAVVVTVPGFDDPTGRSGTLTIGGKTFTVTQRKKP